VIDFVKTQALGNDFILVQKAAVPARNFSKFTQAICHRNFGVGADGVIFWVQKGDTFDLRIFNRDGGEAETSGNGLRCAAAYLMESGRWKQSQIQLRTVSGVHALVRKGDQYEADMGVPKLKPEEIPFVAGKAADKAMDRVINHPFVVDGEELRISLCSTGNPHCSLFVPEIDIKVVERLGPRLENDPAFPNRTNVEFIKVLNDKELRVAFWERGVGVSFASGTGSCGASVAAILNGKTGRHVTVHAVAGKLVVEWPENGRLKLTSTATVVAEGRYQEA
jgi:diaminopimelate epimerase